ncbi:hypothetical protein [Streptomyces sp. bgisy100]|uniref:hypothetical protein n=1 Tax=Streptomyces sp. bgisy100 TaxID=3413783 RepID=UPI003D75EEF9
MDITTPAKGGRKDDTLYAQAAKISYDTSKNGSGRSTGGLTVSGSNWTPPPCWYAPLWNPKEFAKKTEKEYKETLNYPGQANYAKRAVDEYRREYKDGKYKNYNKDKQGKGMWWAAVENPAEPDVLKRGSCDRLPFWADNGKTPNVENAIDPEILAGLAYQQIKVPESRIELNPDDRQTVNLATWAWLDRATFKPISVTASVTGGLNIQATTTATPVALKLDAGTKDVELHPSSGECPIGKDGSIGRPYSKGNAERTPPCGLTYLRATSGTAPYKLRATISWKVEWKGTGGTGERLPDGAFGTDQEVTVQEAQAVVGSRSGTGS